MLTPGFFYPRAALGYDVIKKIAGENPAIQNTIIDRNQQEKLSFSLAPHEAPVIYARAQ